eukprot:INCI10395.3.p1 GENE.INCI10395.3~~INCI10395.3.p1  ORF type:complete len:436 (-),score=86.58 INCI10395.3:108-1415(-)
MLRLLVGFTACLALVCADTYLTITQPLDHENPESSGTFEQSYVWINDTGYERGGPVVLFLGGPSSKFNYQTRLSEFVKYATIFKCTFLLLEHRFYGSSLPAGDEPFSVDKLQYLSVDQALADVEAFATEFQNQHMPDDTKWIIAGAADSASLAAWYAQRFLGSNASGINQQFVAAVASSAALTAEADFRAFFLQFEPAVLNVTAAIPDVGAKCNSVIRQGTEDLAALLSGQNDDGRSEIARLFGACEDTISHEDEFFFKYAVSEVIASSMVLNTPPVWSLNKTCTAALNNTMGGATSQISDAAQAVQRAFQFNMDFEYQLCLEVCNGTSPIDRVSEVVFRPLRKNTTTGTECVSFSEKDWLKSLQDPSNPARAWWWQRCTQLGQFHATNGDHTDGEKTVFFDDIHVEKVVGYCAAIFGIPHLQPDTRRFNRVSRS